MSFMQASVVRCPGRFPTGTESKDHAQNNFPYWSYKQPKEIYYRLASPLVAGGSWLYGRFDINDPHGVTVEPQNAINAVSYYADVGFRVVRCEAGKHPRNGREEMLSLDDIDTYLATFQ